MSKDFILPDIGEGIVEGGVIERDGTIDRPGPHLDREGDERRQHDRDPRCHGRGSAGFS